MPTKIVSRMKRSSSSHAVLDRKLDQLDAIFSQSSEQPPRHASPVPTHIDLDLVNQRLLFLKNLLSAEKTAAASDAAPLHHLRHASHRLHQLESAFRDRDESAVQMDDHYDDDDVLSTCSCTDSCLNLNDDDGGGGVDGGWCDDDGEDAEMHHGGSLVLCDNEGQLDDAEKTEERAVVGGEKQHQPGSNGNGGGWWWKVAAVALVLMGCLIVSTVVFRHGVEGSVGGVEVECSRHYFQYVLTPT